MGKCMHYKKIKLKINGSFTKRINILVYQEPKSHSKIKQIECLVLSSHQLSNEGQQLDQWLCLL